MVLANVDFEGEVLFEGLPLAAPGDSSWFPPSALLPGGGVPGTDLEGRPGEVCSRRSMDKQAGVNVQST